MFHEGLARTGLGGDAVDGLEALLGRFANASDTELGELVDDAASDWPQSEREQAQVKLGVILERHTWMSPGSLSKELGKVVGENASLKSKRRKVIAIANRVTAALEPYAACKPGCSDCCHMNTMIYEHEAIRLAEVTGRPMTRLSYRPPDAVYQLGGKFNGKPCPFLSENRCSVYDDRPMVCRTHHSLNSDATACKIGETAVLRFRPVMYNADLLEVPYMELNAAYNPAEPWGNIAEFFPE